MCRSWRGQRHIGYLIFPSCLFSSSSSPLSLSLFLCFHASSYPPFHKGVTACSRTAREDSSSDEHLLNILTLYTLLPLSPGSFSHKHTRHPRLQFNFATRFALAINTHKLTTNTATRFLQERRPAIAFQSTSCVANFSKSKSSRV